MNQTSENQPRVERFLLGKVVAANTQKTVKVEVERVFQHPRYKKTVRQKKTYLAHDERSSSHLGDTVKIKLVRPISKLKRWLVVQVVVSAKKSEVAHDSDAN